MSSNPFAPVIAAAKASDFSWSVSKAGIMVVAASEDDDPAILVSANGDGSFAVSEILDEDEDGYEVSDINLAAAPDDVFAIFESYAAFVDGPAESDA